LSHNVADVLERPLKVISDTEYHRQFKEVGL